MEIGWTISRFWSNFNSASSTVTVGERTNDLQVGTTFSPLRSFSVLSSYLFTSFEVESCVTSIFEFDHTDFPHNPNWFSWIVGPGSSGPNQISRRLVTLFFHTFSFSRNLSTFKVFFTLCEWCWMIKEQSPKFSENFQWPFVRHWNTKNGVCEEIKAMVSLPSGKNYLKSVCDNGEKNSKGEGFWRRWV